MKAIHPTLDGPPCNRCAGTKRYSNRACVNCTKLHTMARQRGIHIDVLVRQQKELRQFSEEQQNDDLTQLLGDIE